MGPIGENPHKLKKCYINCLNLAEKVKSKHIVFCCISTGVYGYPNQKAAKIAVSTVKKWLINNPETHLEKIVFCCFLDIDLEFYNNLLLND